MTDMTQIDLTASLRAEIEELCTNPPSEATPEFESLYGQFLSSLALGKMRAAQKIDGDWRADTLVKRGILLGFKFGKWTLFRGKPFEYSDKHLFAPPTLPLKMRNIRIVPGGSSVRAGAYLGRNVTMMPPAYINVGAYVDDDTMVDSHALVGSCAQIGKRVHLSAAAQIGGVLEPVGQVPVVIEDDVFVGGNTGVYEGTVVREGAVLAAGVILTRASKVYDVPNERIITAGENGLEIPARAVVVPGSRPASGHWARTHGVSVATPVIVKYRDEKTGASTALEEALR